MTATKERFRTSREHTDRGWIIYIEDEKYCLYEFDNSPEILYAVFKTGDEALAAAIELT